MDVDLEAAWPVGGRKQEVEGVDEMRMKFKRRAGTQDSDRTHGPESPPPPQAPSYVKSNDDANWCSHIKRMQV